eukprot:2747043-Ditylum_brightwellii.AAC.1
MVAYHSIWMSYRIVEQPDNGFGGLCSGCCLLGCNAIDGSQHCRVHCLGIKQQCPKNLLNSVFMLLVQRQRIVG